MDCLNVIVTVWLYNIEAVKLNVNKVYYPIKLHVHPIDIQFNQYKQTSDQIRMKSNPRSKGTMNTYSLFIFAPFSIVTDSWLLWLISFVIWRVYWMEIYSYSIILISVFLCEEIRKFLLFSIILSWVISFLRSFDVTWWRNTEIMWRDNPAQWLCFNAKREAKETHKSKINCQHHGNSTRQKKKQYTKLKIEN